MNISKGCLPHQAYPRQLLPLMEPEQENGLSGPKQWLAKNIKHVGDDHDHDDDTNQEDDDSLCGEPDILQ